MPNKLILSTKYKDFLRCQAPVEFLEGTTMAGKTTVGIFKFMLRVAQSPKKLHIIAANDTGTAEKNIIQKDLGIMDDFGSLVRYNGNGTSSDKISHIVFTPAPGIVKIVYVMGYGDKAKWKKALGGQYGCLYIDEINTANIEFVREASMRADYLMATLNPDDPNLPVYHEYINHARPLDRWRGDTPPEILDELCEEPKSGWVHWFFSFKDNAGLKPEELSRVLSNTPKGTKIYKNKVEGLRGRATGLVFNNFDYKRHVRSKAWARQFLTDVPGSEHFVMFSAGLDTSYSSESEDTISMTFHGLTNSGIWIQLDEKVYNNKDLSEPLAPSDTVVNFIDFLERNRDEWGFSRNTFTDSADQATLTEFAKYKRGKGSIYTFNPAWKKLRIVDRIKHQQDWLQQGCYFILDHCTETIGEMNRYSWKPDKDNEPEDRNDHCINSSQYAWIPYKSKIGCDKYENR